MEMFIYLVKLTKEATITFWITYSVNVTPCIQAL